MSEQKQASTTPRTTRNIGAAADEIFLSPRVVDRQAFNEFAGQLKALIEQAGAQAESLRGAAIEAQRARDGLHETINTNQMKLEMATRALAAIDEKTEQTRRIIEGASDIAARVDDLRSQADQVVNERVGILCQRLNEAEDAAASQVEELHAGLGKMIRIAGERETSLREATDGAAGPLADRLTDLVTRADAMVQGDNGIGRMIARAEEAGRTAIRATSELGEIREQADQARKVLGEALNAAVPIIDDATAVQGLLEGTVGEAIRLTQTAREDIAGFVTEQRESVEEDLQRLTPVADGARAEVETLVRSTDEARRTIAEATAGADQAARALSSLLDQVEPWRRVLLGDGADAPVGTALNSMVIELKQEIRGVAGALRAIAEKAEGALEPVIITEPKTSLRARRD